MCTQSRVIFTYFAFKVLQAYLLLLLPKELPLQLVGGKILQNLAQWLQHKNKRKHEATVVTSKESTIYLQFYGASGLSKPLEILRLNAAFI